MGDSSGCIWGMSWAGGKPVTEVQASTNCGWNSWQDVDRLKRPLGGGVGDVNKVKKVTLLLTN